MKTLLSLLALAVLGSATAIAANGPPINEVCPVCGKNARMIFRTHTDKGNVIFATAECLDSFQKAPSKYSVKPKAKQ